MFRSKKHRVLVGGALAATVVTGMTVGQSAVSAAGTKSSGQKAAIVLFKHYNSFEKAYDKQIITGFERLHPNVTVREDLVPPGEEYTKFATLLAGGDAPNVYVDYDGYGVLAQNELAPVDYKALGVKNRAQLAKQYISSSLLNDFTKNGVLYGVPEELSNYDAFVNKSYYASAGLKVPTTWNQVCADGPKMLVKKGGTVVRDEVAFPVNFPAGEILVMNAIADEFGKPLFNSSGTKSNLTSAPVVAAFQMLQNLVYKCNAFVPSLGGGTSTIERTLYSQGSTAMVLDVGSWFSTSSPVKIQHETVVKPYPTVPGHPSVSPDYQYDYTVQKGTSNVPLSWEFVRYLQSLGGVAFKLGLYSGLKSLSNTSTAKTVPFWNSVWVPTLKSGIYLPSLLKGNEITNAFGNAYASIILNHANVKQALASANSQIVPLLNK